MMWEKMWEQDSVAPRPGRRPLTARTVKKVKASGRTQRLPDGDGLYLLVAPGGSKSWMLRTVVQKRRRDIGLGSARLVTLAEARDRAREFRKTARAGGDPLAQRRQAERAVPTFEAAALRVHESLSQSFKNEKHRKQWFTSLGHVCSSIGAKPVDTITSADILEAVEPRWLERPETSRRVMQRIRAVFEWCKAQGFRGTDNPTQGLTKVLPRHRGTKAHHPALSYRNLPAFIDLLRNAKASESVRLAFEFLILSATRTSETLLATWAEIDTAQKTWTIPASRMKAGVEHRVPLSDRSLELLEDARALSGGSGYVFPGARPGKALSNMAFSMTLRRMDHAHVTPHGFRSTFRDWAAEQTNAPRAVCEAALAHTLRDKTEAAYNRTDLFDKRRELMAAWSRFALAPSLAEGGEQGHSVGE